MKVLFLGHEASRSGAPLLLHSLLRWINANSTIEPNLLLWRGGILAAAYETLIPTRVLCDSLPDRVFDRLGCSALVHPCIDREYPPTRYPLIYANSVATVGLLHRFAGPGRRVVHHVHELAEATRLLGVTNAMRRAVPFTDLYIAASEAVANFLRSDIGVSSERVRVIHEFAINLPDQRSDPTSRKSIRARLRLPESSVLVGMVGTPEARKGTDLFLHLAERVHRSPGGSRVRFLWLGGNVDTQRPYREMACRLGLETICRFQPAVESPEDWFCALDLFALTSREDPFPVAMLEAAASGVPVLCFEGAGGAPELVRTDAGVVVPFLDVEAMATACLRLADDPLVRHRMGACAQARVQQHFLIQHQAPRILAQLQA